MLIRWAAGEGLEKGKKIRVDATAVESDIHHPTDSQLRGKTSLMLDCRVVRGNPADQAQMKTMLKHHCQLYEHYPRQASLPRPAGRAAPPDRTCAGAHRATAGC